MSYDALELLCQVCEALTGRGDVLLRLLLVIDLLRDVVDLRRRLDADAFQLLCSAYDIVVLVGDLVDLRGDVLHRFMCCESAPKSSAVCFMLSVPRVTSSVLVAISLTAVSV